MKVVGIKVDVRLRFLNFIFFIFLLCTHPIFADNTSAGVYDLSEISGSPRPYGARDDAISALRHGEEAQPTRQSTSSPYFVNGARLRSKDETKKPSSRYVYLSEVSTVFHCTLNCKRIRMSV